MRTLEINKTQMWYVEAEGEEDVIDSDGYNTGEIKVSYSEPKQIRLHLYPASGDVLKETFGETTDIDMVTTTNEELNISALLFLEKPTGDYITSYDYRIDKASKSLNNYQYGLKGGR